MLDGDAITLVYRGKSPKDAGWWLSILLASVITGGVAGAIAWALRANMESTAIWFFAILMLQVVRSYFQWHLQWQHQPAEETLEVSAALAAEVRAVMSQSLMPQCAARVVDLTFG